MKPSPNFIWGAAALLVSSTAAIAQTILIDYEDVDTGNGIHDTEVLAGGFTGLVDGNYAPWIGVGVGAAQFRDTLPSDGNGGNNFSGGVNYVTSTNRIIAIDTGYNLTVGDVFDLEFSWRDASAWDADDTMAMVLYYTDDDTIDGSTNNIDDTSTITDLIDFDSGPRAGTATWETESLSDQIISDGNAAGKKLFVRLNARCQTSEFARVDDIFVKVTPPQDPFLVQISGDYAFGRLFHATAGDTTTRTVSFSNIGAANDLTISSISLTDDGGGVYSVTSAPAPSTVIPAGGSFDVEITATGGGGQSILPGELLIDVSPDDQDTTLAISSLIATTGDPFLLVQNRDFESGLASWSTNSVATTGLGSPGGARVRGVGDDQNNPGTVLTNNLAQSFGYRESPDFIAQLSFAIPDFTSFTTTAPSADFYDRSFHVAILGSATLPGGGVFDDADVANTIINLFYFPEGVAGDTGGGFFLYNGGTAGFDRLTALGTLLPSTDFNLDGTPPNTLNVYQLTITGTGFGTGSASYDISISDANMQNVAATASGLTTFHGVDPTSSTAKAIVLTTGDTAADTIVGQNPFQPSFWVDDVSVSLPQTLPLAIFSLTDEPHLIKLFERSRETMTFTVSNIGYGADLTLDTPSLTDSRFTLLSPTTFPQSVAVGETLEFEVEVNAFAVSGEVTLTDNLSLATNDVFTAARDIVLQAQTVPGGQKILIDYDDGIPGNGVHEASIRNGGFEDGMVGDSFVNTPDWFSRFSPEGDPAQLTFANDPATGANHGQTSGFSVPSPPVDPPVERTQPAQIFAPGEWTLEAGDFFEIEVTWKNGPGFVGGDNLQVIMEVFDEDGNLVTSPNSPDAGNRSRIIASGAQLQTLDSYQTNTFVTLVIPENDPWIGHRPLFRVLKNSFRNTFALVDNITLIGRMVEPQMQLTNSSISPASGEVTLRWEDIGRLYKVQGSDDLGFSSNLFEAMVDGTADTTTYPGEIEFSVTDPTGGSRRFWRVATD